MLNNNIPFQTQDMHSSDSSLSGALKDIKNKDLEGIADHANFRRGIRRADSAEASEDLEEILQEKLHPTPGSFIRV